MALVGVRRQSWLAVLAVLGLVGGLLAVGSVGPVGAVDGTADNEAQYSACVGPALESRGLTDVEGSFAEDAVNCLAHYGVTTGRTATTYDPGSPVLRWQMALFLARAAGPAGVSLPANPPGGFTDAAGLPEGTVTAINQMADLGVMPGFSGTVFSPYTNVTRAQMAFMLDAFLGEATIGLGAFAGEVYELSDVSPDDDVFDDIGQVTRGEYSAIRRMFEVGVARGTSDDSFSPQGLVTRAQMAVFITRMLAHTVARPAGLTLQVSEDSITTEETVEVAVSVRGTDLMPVEDRRVDVFQATDPDEAFGPDGRCVSEAATATAGGGLCEIAFGDEVTDPSGDWVTEVDPGDDSVTIWAWTGDLGDRYDADDMTAPSVRVMVTKPGVKLRVTDDMPANATALKFGDTVTFTVQVVDEDGNAVALKDVSFTVNSAETEESAAAGATPTSTSGSSGYKTDEDGKVELEYRRNDPRSGSQSTGDMSRLDLDIGAGKKGTATFTLEDKTTLMKAGADGAGEADAAAVWRDAAAVPSVLKLTQAVEYHEASAANRGTANTVVATLTDQYGGPVSRQVIEFSSDDSAGVGGTRTVAGESVAGLLFDPGSEAVRVFTGSSRYTRTTNRRGVASLSYQRASADSGIETILAVARLGTAATNDDITADRVYHYWAVEPGNGDSAAGRILKADTENNRLILAEANGPITLVKYDSNDQLNSTSGAVLLADFEKELDESDTMAKYASVTAYQTASKNVSRFTSEEDPLEAVASYPAASHDPGSNRATAANTERNLPAVLFSTAAEGWFGHSFDVAKGIIMVGAPEENSGANTEGAGKVYIYETPGDTTPIVLDMETSAADNKFGQVVALSDDGNVMVASRPGLGSSVMVDQKGADETWSAEFGGDDFGNDAQGTETVGKVLGRPTDLAAADLESTTLNAADVQFGESIAVSGDGKVIAVGAPKNDQTRGAWTRGGSGVVYVYWLNTAQMDWGAHPASWITAGTRTVTVTNSKESSITDTTTNRVSNYGGNGAIAVSKDGKIVAVGVPEANIGAPGNKDNAGAVYVHVNTGTYDAWSGGGDWAPEAKLTASTATSNGTTSGDGTADEMLGAAIDISDDGLTIVATAPGTGKVYVFEAPAGNWIGTATNPDPVAPKATITGAGSNYAESDLPVGRNIAIKGDASEIVVGNGGKAAGDWRGSVSLYKKPTGDDGWADTSTADMEWIGQAPNQRFGWQVAYDQSNGDIYASGYTPVYGTDTMGTADDTSDDTRVVETAEYTIYRINRN